MSSTGRAGVRREGDFYATPEHCTEAVLPFLPDVRIAQNAIIVDPGAGTGAITRPLCRRYGGHAAAILAVEINPALAAEIDSADRVVVADYLTAELPPANLIVGNPPFSLAQEFVARSLLLAAPVGGTVAMLLRLSFIASKKRRDFHRSHPSDVYVLSSRPSFTGKGTDSCDYAWFVWGPGERGRIFVL